MYLGLKTFQGNFVKWVKVCLNRVLLSLPKVHAWDGGRVADDCGAEDGAILWRPGGGRPPRSIRGESTHSLPPWHHPPLHLDRGQFLRSRLIHSYKPPVFSLTVYSGALAGFAWWESSLWSTLGIACLPACPSGFSLRKHHLLFVMLSDIDS